MAELVDAPDLKSVVPKGTCPFESGRGHHAGHMGRPTPLGPEIAHKSLGGRLQARHSSRKHVERLCRPFGALAVPPDRPKAQLASYPSEKTSGTGSSHGDKARVDPRRRDAGAPGRPSRLHERRHKSWALAPLCLSKLGWCAPRSQKTHFRALGANLCNFMTAMKRVNSEGLRKFLIKPWLRRPQAWTERRALQTPRRFGPAAAAPFSTCQLLGCFGTSKGSSALKGNFLQVRSKLCFHG